MIDIISNWAGELVVAMIVASIIEMILPDNKIKKYVKTLIGVYIIFCIISPFINESKVISMESIEKEFESYSKELKVEESQRKEISMENLYIEQFRQDVINNVRSLGYIVNKCEVDIEMDATKENAGINRIIINIGKKDVSQKRDTSNIKIDNIENIQIGINSIENEKNNNKLNESEDTKIIQEYLSEYYQINSDRVRVIQD